MKKKRFNRVHAVCQALRDGINCKRDTLCKLCPMREHTKGIGWTVRGCVWRAQEVIQLAKTGWPWGRRPTSKRGRDWRKRWQKA